MFYLIMIAIIAIVTNILWGTFTIRHVVINYLKKDIKRTFINLETKIEIIN